MKKIRGERGATVTPCVAAIHDLSCFGRCSLTIAMPVLAAMGIQCCPLPTALLSTHTGGFEGYSFLDTTAEMEKITAHWQALDLRFQGIYSGFLGSEAQMSIVADFIRDFRKEDTIVVVDPVMGDHGKAYKTYTPAMCTSMWRLAAVADVITPNLTEAAILLGEPYESLKVDEAGSREIVERLSLNGQRSVVLTGYSETPQTVGAMCFDRKSGKSKAVQVERVPQNFHGTGDLFASVLTGALVQGEDLLPAAKQAAEFVRASVEYTAGKDLPHRNGVDFEPLLKLLMK